MLPVATSTRACVACGWHTPRGVLQVSAETRDGEESNAVDIIEVDMHVIAGGADAVNIAGFVQTSSCWRTNTRYRATASSMN